MQIALFDKERLRALAKVFYTLTGAAICFFDSDFNCITNFGESPEFCKNIRLDSVRHNKCLLSDMTCAAQCSRLGRAVPYTCHCGLMETVSPLVYKGITLGYVIFGGLKDKDGKYCNENTVKNACIKYGLNYDEYLEYYNNLTEFDPEKLSACIELLNIFNADIFSEKHIDIDERLLPVKILSYIHENFTSDISPSSLCEMFGVGEKYLYSAIKKITGKTVNVYVTELKINHAKQLLKQHGTSVAAVAAATGFNDYNYFIKVFKAHTGLTPLAYAKSVL